jgi:uncharacterized protein YuzB (UPF0349 family)
MITINHIMTLQQASVIVHNVKLVDVRQTNNGHELLIVEHGNALHELIGGGKWDGKASSRNIGEMGYIIPARSSVLSLPAGACYFRAYADQSLRRIPELDCHDWYGSDHNRTAVVVGWCCDARPHGFRAPIGIVPGEGGSFVPDETVAITLQIPPEFARECRRVQLTPSELLRSFIADLAGIQNYVMCPRADLYSSNGSDEREYAQAWLERAHGMDAIDLDALNAAEQEARDQQLERDDFADLLDEFKHCGGSADELFAAVQALIVQRAEGQAE